MTCEIIRRSETSCRYSLWEVSTDNYPGHTRPSAQCDYRSALQGCSLTDVAGKSETGMTELSPGSLQRHGHRQLDIPPQSGASRALLPARPKQVLNSSGLMWDARVQAVCQNHFGSN